MPRTIESILDAHHAATDRRNAGRPIWDGEVNLRGIFHQDLPFTEVRDLTVTAIKRSRWYKDRDADGFDEFGELVDILAESRDQEDFAGALNEVYDAADYNRIWMRSV